jgi:putative transposase
MFQKPAMEEEIALRSIFFSTVPCQPGPNQFWAGDISFVRKKDRWLYLAVVIDLNSRAIVGWAPAEHMRSGLVSEAFNNALRIRSIDTTLIFHSDRGSQFGSRAYRIILDSKGINQSMSARANPYHNAGTESFMGIPGNEMLQDEWFQTFADAETEISDFIDVYYNRSRKHSSPGYLSSEQFELQNASKN